MTEEEEAETQAEAEAAGTAAKKAAPPLRPPAPETRCAEAAAQATVLENSSAALRAAGLTEKADELATEAARLRKTAASAPPPGQRLDSQQRFLARAKGRATKAASEIEQAQAMLEKAQATLEEAQHAKHAADKEVEEAETKLDTLKKDLAATGAAMDDGEGSTPKENEATEAELSRLRALLQRVENDRDAAHLAAGRTAPEPQNELTREEEAELEELLRKEQEAFATALTSGTATAQRAGALAVLTARLEGARTKRRRVGEEAGIPPQ